MLWFQAMLDDDQKCLTAEEMHELVLLYISRFDEEMDSIKAQIRPGRPIPKRLDELQMAKKQEEQEYASTGFSVPELKDARNVEILKGWNGDYNGLATIKQIRLLDSAKSS
jgi:translation machinery-associated protein 16